MFTRHTHVPNCAEHAQAGKLKSCVAAQESAQQKFDSLCRAEMFAEGAAL
jgi:hypothetical protein